MGDQHLIIELGEEILAELLVRRAADACRAEGAVVRNISREEPGGRTLVLEGRDGSLWVMQRGAVVDAAGDPAALAGLRRILRAELCGLRADIDGAIDQLLPADPTTARPAAAPSAQVAEGFQAFESPSPLPAN